MDNNSSGEPTKQCPDCGGSVKQTSSICRNCGYTFSSGTEPVGTSLAGSQTTGTGLRPTSTSWVMLAGLIAGVALLVIVIGITARQYQVCRSWDYTVQHLPPRQSYDGSFEAWLQGWVLRNMNPINPSDRSGVTIYASGGTCLIKLPEGKTVGFLGRMGLKGFALSISGFYAAYRNQKGDDPVASCAVFQGRKRLVQVTFNGHRNAKELAALENVVKSSMSHSSPEALMAEQYQRLRDDLKLAK